MSKAPTRVAAKEARVPREEATSTTEEARRVAGPTGDATTGGRRVARTEARTRTETSKANSPTVAVARRSTRTTNSEGTSEGGVAAISDTTVDSTDRGVPTTRRRESRAGTRRARPHHRARRKRDVRTVHAVALASRTEREARETSRQTSRHRVTAIRLMVIRQVSIRQVSLDHVNVRV